MNLRNKLPSDFFPFDLKFIYTKMYKSLLRKCSKYWGSKYYNFIPLY